MVSAIMKKSCMSLIVVLTFFFLCVQGVSPREADAGLYKIIMYVPNRVFDLLDIFRVRLRAGPGLSAGVRATAPASFFLGSHRTVYAGLPGPRGGSLLPVPVGFDSARGARVSLADMGGANTHYDFFEVGGEMQVFILGLNIGISPLEIADFASGLVCIDIVGDDL
jgi:hypothetical protein